MNGINLGRIYANDVAIDNVGNETLGFATVDNTTHVFILTQEKDGLYFITVELTDTRGATYIAKAESISEQVPGKEDGS